MYHRSYTRFTQEVYFLILQFDRKIKVIWSTQWLPMSQMNSLLVNGLGSWIMPGISLINRLYVFFIWKMIVIQILVRSILLYLERTYIIHLENKQSIMYMTISSIIWNLKGIGDKFVWTDYSIKQANHFQDNWLPSSSHPARSVIYSKI